MSTNQVNIFGKIQAKRIKIEKKELIDHWAALQQEGDDIVIRITNQKDYYTHRQLKLLYKCFRTISEFTGYGIEEIKLMLKQKAGLFYSYIIEGKDYTIIKSVGDLSKLEMSQLIEFTDRWSTQTLSLPLLNSDDIQFLKNG